MFDLARSSLFFERMDAEHPEVVQNIEIVHENKRLLDSAYHQPKHFILSLNNLLRSLLFFVENSIKNSPSWLNASVTEFREVHRKDYEMLKYLRNVSAHQKLIFPAESLVTGLFRVYSNTDYKLKLGHGNHREPASYAPDLAFKNTADIFDNLLTFSSLAFMDLEHCAFAECLGVTRRWFYKADFKFNEKNVHEVIDVYNVTSSFSESLLDHVCISFARNKGLQFDKKFTVVRAEHNNVNTLLELDLYPSLFSGWWEDRIEPLNFGVRVDRNRGRIHQAADEYYSWVYEHLVKEPAEYESMLSKFANLEPDVIFTEEYLMEFLSFVTNNHWHFKKAFPGGFMKSKVTPSDVMMLQRYGRTLVDEYKTGKLCTIKGAKDQLNGQIAKIIGVLGSTPSS
ncbi:hypothetical protein H8L32_04345 [Undibacterium sp. CY18W]|uniref:Abi-like protein n=1 Tax=Undibacterium hunanense TaxID=2762292 RepID=A0ABR6ZLD6_9BURK|nr:hypothetical protein [Undibacterium hunanense]MBC3916707.1 hypothetical protein [Undibacterium hunanense]